MKRKELKNVAEVIAKRRGVLTEFKEFINRGSVVDIGVAFVMGATFKTMIDAFAGDGKDQPGILGALIGAMFGGNQPDFSKKVLTLNGSAVPVGAFATSVMNFVLVGFAMFLVVKVYNRFRATESVSSTDQGSPPPT